MPCTEAYKEHIMYTFHGFCKVVICNAAITAWRDRQRRHKREISLEYLTEEKLKLSILVDTFISKISLPVQPDPEIGNISAA